MGKKGGREGGGNASDVFEFFLQRCEASSMRLIDVSRYVSVSIKEKKQAEVIFRSPFNSIT